MELRLCSVEQFLQGVNCITSCATERTRYGQCTLNTEDVLRLLKSQTVLLTYVSSNQKVSLQIGRRGDRWLRYGEHHVPFQITRQYLLSIFSVDRRDRTVCSGSAIAVGDSAETIKYLVHSKIVSDHLLHRLEMVQHSAATEKLALAVSEMSHPVHNARILCFQSFTTIA